MKQLGGPRKIQARTNIFTHCRCQKIQDIVCENEATVSDIYLALDITNELAREEVDEGECNKLVR